MTLTIGEEEAYVYSAQYVYPLDQLLPYHPRAYRRKRHIKNRIHRKGI